MTEKQNGTDGTTNYGTLADIRAASAYRYLDVVVPEWGGAAYRLRSMKARQAAEFVDMKDDQKKELMPKLIRQCLVDANNEPMIKSDEDFEALHDSDLRGFLRLQNAMVEMNGLNDKKETAKNA